MTDHGASADTPPHPPHEPEPEATTDAMTEAMADARFRALAQAVAEIVFRASASGEMLELSGLSAAVGRAPEALLGRGWLEVVHLADRAGAEAAWGRSIDFGARLDATFRLCMADGSERRVRARAAPVRDAGGAIREWVGVFLDVEEALSAREALERQSALFKLVTDNATSALFVMDERGRPTFMNPAAERMTGFALGEIQGRPLHDAIHHTHPDGRPYPMDECPIDRALPTNNDLRAHEDRFVRKDGTFFPVSCAAMPIVQAGVPVGTVVEVRDVTEEKRAGSALRQSEERFRFLADAIPVQVWTAGPDGGLDHVSERVLAYLGRSRESILRDGWRDVVHPEDFPIAAARWASSLETGEPYEVQFRLLGADGAYAWHLGRAVALRDASGRILKWFGTNTLIHAQKLAEQVRDQALASAHFERGRLQQLLTQAPAVIAIYRGPEHVVAMANPLWEKFVGRRGVVGRALRDIFPELEGSGIFEIMGRVYATHEPFAAEEMRVPIDRHGTGVPEQTYWNFVLQPIVEADGRVDDILAHAVEVTEQVRARHEIERKAAELARTTEALERSNQELDRFAYVASHDLKAPLRGIASLAEWIDEDLGERVTAEAREHLRLLHGRVKRMDGLIDGILRYSRAGRTLSEPEPLDVRALVRETIELLAPPPEAEVRLGEGLGEVRLVAERIPLQQVLLNLVGNALKHGARPGARTGVDVDAREVGDEVEFRIKDDGPGIEPRFQERIWGIFQTLETRDKVEGTGIGLSVVRKIVESRGGRAWLESEPGKGSTFCFTLPKIPRA